MKKNFSMKFKFYALLVFTMGSILTGAFIIVNTTHNETLESLRTRMANEIANEFIKATSFNAIERGISNVVLSRTEGNVSGLMSKIKKLRIQGDDNYNGAWAHFQTYLNEGGSNQQFIESMESLKIARIEMEKARKQVDSHARDFTSNISSKAWVEVSTAYIMAQTEARVSAFSSTAPIENARFLNLTLNHEIWLAGENAGKERAMIGSIIASGRAFTDQDMREIYYKRGIVDNSLEDVLHFRSKKNTNPELKHAIVQMEEEFLGTFQNLRNRVFLEGKTGDYTITASEWIKISTEAINSILKVSEVASKSPDTILKSLEESSNKEFQTILGITAVILLGCIVFVINFAFFMLPSINNNITNLASVAERLKSTSGGVESSSQELSATASEQAASIEETAASLEELSSMVDQNVSQAEKTRDFSNSMKESSNQASNQMKELVNSMSEILNSTNQIKQLVKVIGDIGEKTDIIDDIVFQTKILSFNASVEAERAGEHGRGFAVVAQEVSNLAQMSGKAALEISSMVKESIKQAESISDSNSKKVEDGSRIVHSISTVLDDITSKSEMVLSNSAQILVASKDQSVGISQVNTAAGQLDQATQKTAYAADQASMNSTELNMQAQELNNAVKEILQVIKGDSLSEELRHIHEQKVDLHKFEEKHGNIFPLKKKEKLLVSDPYAETTMVSGSDVVSSDHSSGDDWEKL